MSGSRGIALALDLVRIPALAQSIEKAPLPTDIFEIMRIATGSPEILQWASQVTGQPPAVLIKAARFYLQQALLRPDADPYHVLGLPAGASRELARRHLQCLLQWLHPDVNRDWDSVYAERVLKAWREVSANVDSSRHLNSHSHVLAVPESGPPVNSASRMRLPWIKEPKTKMKIQQPKHVVTSIAKRVGIGFGVVGLLVAALIAVCATQFG